MHIAERHIPLSEAEPNAFTTILDVHAALDGTSVDVLVESVQASLEKGTRRMVINLAEVDRVSSAGLVGLYMIGELLEGTSMHDRAGWAVFEQMRLALEHGKRFANLRLAAANQNVAHSLQTTTFDRLVPTLATVDAAVAADPAW